MPLTDLQKTIFYTNYSRWNSDKKRRETWEETVDRVIEFLNQTLIDYSRDHNVRYPNIDILELREAMLKMEVLPSMRVLQMAGPALDRCNVGAYNCAYLPLKDWRSLAELLYILMQGTGVGFSVEHQYVDQLPTILTQNPHWHSASREFPNPPIYIIEDSTEGWCDALVTGLEIWTLGGDVEFDYSQIRPYGAPLKTKGGRSSGPEPLKQLLTFARKLLLNHQGRKLSSLNVHDLACYCGAIVQVGGIRRAAEISLSDLGDTRMRGAKSGQFWLKAPERAMANNSAVYNEKPDVVAFTKEWLSLMESGTGERGIFNRTGIINTMPERRDDRFQFGVNPCGEIILRPYEFCNLSIAVARPYDDIIDLQRKVKLATQFGIIQSLLTKFNYIREEWAINSTDERLLGVDITGQMDNELFGPSYRYATYANLQSVALNESHKLAKELGIANPAAVTTVKPSGNSSQLLGCSSGIHPRYAPYYIRRIRINATNPVAKLLIDSGVPHFPEVSQPPDNPTVWVFEFPVKSPYDSVYREDVGAIQQLEQWLTCKMMYTEHNPSCTIYVKENEWLKVGAWVYEFWDQVGGLSFLPYDGGVYDLAPYEEITEQEYEKRQKAWPVIDFKDLAKYETADTTEVNREYSCTGDKCEL